MQSRSSKRLAGALTALMALTLAACERDATTTDESDTEDTGVAGTAETFGDLEFPCGPKADGGRLPTGDAEETFGITSEGINVGTFADPGYEGAPGISQEVFDATDAFVAECNDAGGINGRPIISHLRDSALFEYPARVAEACDEDFAVVGGEAALDDSGAQQLTDCGLVSFPAVAINAQAALADNVVEALPNSPYVRSVAYLEKLVDEIEADGAGTDLDPDEIMDNAGILYGDIQVLANAADRIEQTAGALGFEFVYEATYNVLGEANWTPFAAEIASEGVEILFYVGTPEYFVQLEEAMDELGSAPAIFVHENNFYSPVYSDGTAGLLPDTVKLVHSEVWPMERADENPATQRYLDILDEHVPDGRAALLGIESTSAWLLFAQVAAQCDRANDLTRSCVYDQGRAVSSWTAGGLQAETNPEEGAPATCQLLIEATGDGFEIWRADGETPDDAYFCDADAIVEVEGDYGEGVRRQGG
jgi:hypothetical protein